MAEHAVKTEKKSSRGGRSGEEEREEEVRRRRGGDEGTQAGRQPSPTAAVRSVVKRRRPGLGEVFHVYGPADMSTLLPLSASQLIRTPPSARGTNKKR